MFNILVCDDEEVTCSYIEKIFISYSQVKKMAITVEIFPDGEKLVQYMELNNDIDLIFLDIELPGISGAEVGRLLRERLENEAVQIVFISSKEKYAMQLFQVRPFDFLIKPMMEETLIGVFEKYRRLYGRKTKFFEYRAGRDINKILLSEILYFACEKKRICIVCKNSSVYFYGSMKEMHKSFQAEGFWPVHNSFIINERYIKEFKENGIVMCDGAVIPISNAYKRDIRKKIMENSRFR